MRRVSFFTQKFPEKIEELFGKLSPSSAYIIKITQEMRNGKNEQKTIKKLNC